MTWRNRRHNRAGQHPPGGGRGDPRGDYRPRHESSRRDGRFSLSAVSPREGARLPTLDPRHRPRLRNHLRTPYRWRTQWATSPTSILASSTIEFDMPTPAITKGTTKLV